MGFIEEFLGPLFIGLLVATALWGVTCVQAWTYYTRPRGLREDPKWLMALVFLVWAVDTIHQILISLSVYDYCVKFFGNPLLLNTIPGGAWSQVFAVQVVALLVHAFYIYRIWRLSKGSWYLTIPVVLITLAELGAAADEMVAVVKSYSWISLLANTKHITVTLDALLFATDLSISGVMCYLLARNNTEYEKTRSIIKRIAIFTFSTNLITSICALMVLVMSAAFPTKVYFIPFFNVTSRLYANSLIAALNMRPYLAKGMQSSAYNSSTTAQDTSAIQLPTWQAGSVPRVGYAEPFGRKDTEWQESSMHMDDKFSHAHKGSIGVSVQVERHTDV